MDDKYILICMNANRESCGCVREEGLGGGGGASETHVSIHRSLLMASIIFFLHLCSEKNTLAHRYRRAPTVVVSTWQVRFLVGLDAHKNARVRGLIKKAVLGFYLHEWFIFTSRVDVDRRASRSNARHKHESGRKKTRMELTVSGARGAVQILLTGVIVEELSFGPDDFDRFLPEVQLARSPETDQTIRLIFIASGN